MLRILGALVVTMGSAMASVDPVLGLWQTEPDDGAYAHVEMAPCGAAICGTIRAAFDANGPFEADTIGRVLVMDMASEGPGAYRGRVWRPSNDRTYLGKITLEGDRLELAGCVAGGLLCARQTWARLR